MKTHKLSKNSLLVRLARKSSPRFDCNIRLGYTTDTCKLAKILIGGLIQFMLASIAIIAVIAVLIVMPISGLWLWLTSDMNFIETLNSSNWQSVGLLFLICELGIAMIIGVGIGVRILLTRSEVSEKPSSLNAIRLVFKNISEKTCSKIEIVE